MGRAVHRRNAIAHGRGASDIVGARVCVASRAPADQLARGLALVVAAHIRMCVGIGGSIASRNAAPVVAARLVTVPVVEALPPTLECPAATGPQEPLMPVLFPKPLA